MVGRRFKLVFLSFLIAAGLWVLAKIRSAETERIDSIPTSPEMPAPQKTGAFLQKSPPDSAQVSPNQGPTSPLITGKLGEKMKKDYEKNPTVTSASLIAFAESLAPDMEKAKGDATFASAFFDRLAECARQEVDDGSFTAQSVCAVNARTLSKVHQDSLGPKYESLYKSLREEVRSLVRAVGS